MMFEAVILAGGKGTRLKSVSGNIPKPMIDINGKPFLYIIMQQLEMLGCVKIVLSLGYQSDYIVKRVSEDKPVACSVEYSIEEFPLGTGGAIKLAANKIESDKFLVLNGDTYSELDFRDMLNVSSTYDLTISGIRVEDASRYGTLNIDEYGNVIGMNEKGIKGGGVVNSGSYVIAKEDILSFPREVFSFEEDYISSISNGFFAYISDGYFIDIGIPEDYYKACLQIK
ncbi:nucleotidyltransferase family protein [Vibrio vulnificus]|nr:nucleotidyltransferase family protein [Vibrio vulnificus]EKG2460215.1 nucleotidyltransferase family protein [Vibrio vulnificus]